MCLLVTIQNSQQSTNRNIENRGRTMLQSYILYIYIYTQENGKKIVTEYTHTVVVVFLITAFNQLKNKQTNKQATIRGEDTLEG